MEQAYRENGYYLLKQFISDEQVSILRQQLTAFDGCINAYGVRGLMLKLPYVKAMALSPPLLDIAQQLLGRLARPVRSVFFDKLPEANWNVAWHQDTSIALKSKHEMPGFKSWTEKQGVVHAEPPVEYLTNTLSLRIHLDVANAETGGLRVIPSSHKDGRVHSSKLLKIVENTEVVECNADSGDVLLMNPLLFHSSRKASKPTHRRIVHIEYSAMKLPPPLSWFECVS